jgi:hypothetical protein
MTAQNGTRSVVPKRPSTLSDQETEQFSVSGGAKSGEPAPVVRVQCPPARPARRSVGVAECAASLVAGGRRLMRVKRIAVTAVVAGVVAGGVLAPPASATSTVPACPDAVIPSVPIIPNAVGCWNAIAVQATRIATPYQPQGFLYMGYIQAAVYDAVMKIDGRYMPYHEFPTPAGVDAASASPDAAAATAAYTMLTSSFLAFPATVQAGLSTTYSDYVSALGGMGTPAVADGIKIGQAAASDLISERIGDRNESITFTPGPLTPGGWTFAPPPSVQSAQTPWLALMKPFMLNSPSQFRVEPPPALSSRKWAREFNEVKAYGAVNSLVRSPEQTSVAKFWNAFAVNQSNQAFQDVAITHSMDLVDAARLLAMGDLVDSDVAIACWDSKYNHLFWRPIMAIRNAQIDGNPATQPDTTWTPLLTTPNHPEYPAAHTCLTGAEAKMYAVVLETHHIDVTIRGSADGTANNWSASHTFETVNDLDREVVNARVWAGLHYRGSALEGLELGRQVARFALRRYFLPADERDRHPEPRARR